MESSAKKFDAKEKENKCIQQLSIPARLGQLIMEPGI